MRKRILMAVAAVIFVQIANAQNDNNRRSNKQHLRLYAQFGLMSTSVRHTDPSKDNRELFRAKGISHPGFGLGAIIESKSEKPRFFFGLGFYYTKVDYGGERYVRIISPSQEELEVYKAKHNTIGAEFLVGHYIHLGSIFSLKPQLGMAIHSYPTNTLDIAVYNYQNGDFKREVSYERPRQTRMLATAGFYVSVLKRFEVGVNYYAPTTNTITLVNSSRLATWGGVLRYVHSF
jgi:hypothetical protein